VSIKLPPHIRWPAFIAGALALQVVSSLITIYLATTNPSYAVEDDYYQKALRWDETRAQQRRNFALGWNLTFEVQGPAAPGDRAEVSVSLLDAASEPIDGAIIELETFHNARADDILKTTFVGTGDGTYTSSLPMRRSGLWEFRFVVTRGSDTFTLTQIRHLLLD
jgi:nitrogen fixation protein FixH